MRYSFLVVLAIWTVGMAAVFLWGLYLFTISIRLTFIHGATSTLNGAPLSWWASVSQDLGLFGVYLGFSGVGVALGLIGVRRLLQRPEDVVIPVPSLRGSIFPVHRTSIVFTAFCLFVYLLGLGLVLQFVTTWYYTGIALGDEHNQPIAVLLVGFVFALTGHAMLNMTTSSEIDVKGRTWRASRGYWPFRKVQTGWLNEASQIAVATETREGDEGGRHQVAVARLEWLDPSRSPMILVEKICWREDEAIPSVRRWAREVADLLNLPLDKNREAHLPQP